MANNPAKSFHDAQEQLFKSTIPEDLTYISDDKLGDQILDFIIKRERIRHGYQADDIVGTSELDLATISKLKTWDTEDPTLMGIEKVFRVLTEGRTGYGTFLLKNIIQSKAKIQSELISSEQQRKASTPRAPHPIDTLILSLLEAEPRLTLKQIERKLETFIGGNTVFDIDEREITPVDDRYKPISLSGLKDRVTRIKKKISH